MTESPEKRLEQLQYGGVWEFLQTQNPERYHEYLYELLIDAHPLAPDALMLLLREIQRLEPDQREVVEVVIGVVNLLDELETIIDVRDCLQLSEMSPFSYTPKTEEIMQLVRDHATKENLPISIRVCEAVSLNSQDCVKEFIVKQLQDPTGKE